MSFRALSLAAAITVTGCASHTVDNPSAVGPVLPSTLSARAHGAPFTFGKKAPQTGIIKHVIIVVQENRSFNNLFMGYPGATTATSGLDHQGNTIQLRPISLAAAGDISHSSTDFFHSCDGTGSVPGTDCKMDGFDLEQSSISGKDPEYSFAPRKETKLYWQMAQQYVLADAMHTSHIDQSFVSHQYLIAAQANSSVDLPSGGWGCTGGKQDKITTLLQDRSYGPPQLTCQNYQTLGDVLDKASLSWRYYAVGNGSDLGFLWSAYRSIKHIFNGPDWAADVISPPAQFLTDVSNGTLADVTWIAPTFETSDHPGAKTAMGPQWVASVVNAVGQSPFWKDSAIFVMWDEWGGLYDPVDPPYVDYDGLGFRVGLLMISPYARKNYVTHVQYEHGSLLRFAEDAFNLPQLSASDTRANDPAYDAFDFTHGPRKFKSFATGLQAGYFQRLPISTHSVDDDSAPK